MIRINQLKLPIGHTRENLEKRIRKKLRLREEQAFSYEIVRQSLDARKKQEKYFSYCVDISAEKERRIVKKVSDKNIMLIKPQRYHFPEGGEETMRHRPVIAGSGPAGLFCGYMLASRGYQPLILERGEEVHRRREKVEQFWRTGNLDVRSNVQFGEGGAGTFSDGKLNTLVKDPAGRNRRVLEIFVECGAPKEILYQQKPHLGTDALVDIVETMRKKIESMGGEFRFSSQLTDLIIRDGRLTGIQINDSDTLKTDVLVLAIGHSARDTFRMLYDRGLDICQKSFAVGVRVEHLQRTINCALYGEEENPILGAAAYKLTAKTSAGRGVYTFCMCPGGYVVNASSEEGYLAVNGMSYRDRGGRNANSAVIVTVSPEDFGSDHPLAGVEYQRRLERAAYEAAGGAVPVQLYRDFCAGEISRELGTVTPAIMGRWDFADLNRVFPRNICESIREAMPEFDRRIPGFAAGDTILSGVESRTSSPVRIRRNERLESSAGGIYPCGEGAGYAGGITSAAMDGVRVAEQIAARFRRIL